jgi:type VI secretion system secreted protein VgrG
MAGGQRLTFELRLGSLSQDELRVRRIAGSEALSAPFRFEVEFTPLSGAPLELEPLVGAEAALSIRRPDGTERWVNGLCGRVALVGLEPGGPAYRAVLVPRLERLAAGEDCRVFQGRSAVEMVKALLDSHGVKHRDALAGRYLPRELCTQYRESDFAFVSRLLEEEGIAYWFEHASDGHTLVLGDAPGVFPALPGDVPLPFRREDGAVRDEEHVFALRRNLAVVPARATLRDFDFERPAVDGTGQAAAGEGEEVYEYPSGGVQPDETRRRAGARLDALRFEGETWEGRGTAERLAPGFVFEIEGHPDPSFDVRLVAVRVEHEGRQEKSAGAQGAIDDSYRNRFLAAPAGRPFRPGLRTPRGLVNGPQTATVVGPPGEEIHPDGHGRIKVQFHWDREGERDDRASAWVRLAQGWAGPGLGAVFVPRAGQEVLVRFLEGNPDRPLVTGAVYNGGNPPPIALPGERTKSTLRTDSSPQGGGFNELRFEDRKDAEELHLHAQKDEKIEVLNDKAQRVGGNEQLRVEKDRSVAVIGQQQLEVQRDDRVSVGGSRALRVTGDRTTEVFGGHAEAVGAGQAVTVGGNRDVSVHAAASEVVVLAAALTVGGAYAVSVGAAENVAVGGALGRQVVGVYSEWVGAARDARVGGDASARVGGNDALDLREQARLTVGGDLQETVGEVFESEAGTAADWMAGGFELEAERLNLVVGGVVMLTMAQGQITFGGTSFTVNGNVALRGASVAKLGAAPPSRAAPAVTQVRELEARRSLVSVRVADREGKPLANVPVRVEMPDGSVQVVRSDAQGHAVASAPRDGMVKLSLPEHDQESWEPKG